MEMPVHIVGGGLAGSEAAWQIAKAGVSVVVHEMRPVKWTGAHTTDSLAELVCSNSFRSSDSRTHAVGLLHEELRRAGSLILQTADEHRVPAGSALAVDRERFSQTITEKIHTHPLIRVEREEMAQLPPKEWGSAIIATGPLTSSSLAAAIQSVSGQEALAFFDAIAPIVYRESIDFGIAWFQSRYDKEDYAGGGASYINSPMDRACYEDFLSALLSADTMSFRDWEKNTPYFDGCLPIEIMAARGPDTLRYGPMKPIGLTNPHKPGEKPYAVVQLRQDNVLGTLYNMVGFQTKLKHAEQVRIFRTIPGLGQAKFARLGGLHRNTFLDSPRLLDKTLRLKAEPRLRFAGQITGCEGYVESTAIGLVAGRLTAADRLGKNLPPPPETTATGALLHYISAGHMRTEDGSGRSFQPMKMNFGLLPPLPSSKAVHTKRSSKDRAAERRQALSARALAAFDAWLSHPENLQI